MTERHGSLSAEQVARLDEAAGAVGVGVEILMELAGWQVARCAWRMLRGVPGVVAVVAGRGNNGGDGAVAARHLASWGCAVAVHVLVDPERVADPLATQVSRARRNGVDVSISGDPAGLDGILTPSGIVVDALLGTGLSRPPEGAFAGAIRRLSLHRVLSVDVPSGLQATTGEVFDPCVRADMTCTLGGVKAGLLTPAGRAQAGELQVADIGIPREAWRACGMVPPAAVRGGDLVPVPALVRPSA